MANQQICINRKKENFRKKKRIVKKSMRNQINSQPEVLHSSDPIMSDKKVRRQARKQEIKQQKKLNKLLKRQHKMDVEDSD